jgi:uncharacterized protein (TIGR00290 family)
MTCFFNWSGGKDSSLALYKLLQSGIRPKKLLTSYNKDVNRVTMHGVAIKWVEEQARLLDIPLEWLEMSDTSDMESYEKQTRSKLEQFKAEGIQQGVFGDIYLEDLKEYREKQLQRIGMQTLFPLWKQDTHMLAQEFIELGFKAIIVSADASKIPRELAGAAYDHDFLEKIPAEVDPCGENGEFHTFVYGGPIFKKEIAVRAGELHEKTYRYKTKEGQELISRYYFTELEAQNA